jgi:hypothetical protein
MKYTLLFILAICALYVRSQSGLDDAILLNVTQNIKSGQAMEISKLDSIQQHKVITYLQTYDSDSILYMNINSLFGFLSESFFSSSYTAIRQDAAILLLDIYRICRASDDNGFWHKKAKQADFNSTAQKKILNILKAVPFTDKEKELLYKNELQLQRNSFSGDTLRTRAYAKTSTKTMRKLQDSLATSVAMDNVSNIKPEQYILPGIVLLSAWLDMKEAVPIIVERLEYVNSENIRDLYKLSLARLGNAKHETEILTKPNIAYYLSTIGFLASRNALDKVIKELKEDKSHYKIEMSAGNPLITIPYICQFLIFQDDVNFIMDFPFKYNKLSLDCDIGKEEKNKIIKWLEQNRDKIVLNRDYH